MDNGHQTVHGPKEDSSPGPLSSALEELPVQNPSVEQNGKPLEGVDLSNAVVKATKPVSQPDQLTDRQFEALKAQHTTAWLELIGRINARQNVQLAFASVVEWQFAWLQCRI